MQRVTTPSTEVEVEAELAVHIVGVSAGLVGVCLTVIGLLRLVLHLQDWNTRADNHSGR